MALTIKKALFYLLVAGIMLGGPFFVSNNHLQGKPPVISKHTLSGDHAVQITQDITLIYFWAEWCGICKMMQSAVSDVLTEYSGITVAVKSGTDNHVKQYMQDKQLTWQVINDVDGEIAQQYGIKGVPTLIILNKAGEVAFAVSGYVSGIGMTIRIWLVNNVFG